MHFFTFSSFLRTIPNDDEQAVAMVDLLEEFEWQWVGAIVANNEYGRSGISNFLDIAKSRNICVEIIEYVDEVIIVIIPDFNYSSVALIK